MTATLKLYTFWRSSAAYRVRIALNFKGLEYQSIPRDLRLGEQREAAHLSLNPQGLIPVLIDGGQALTQSLAIIEYLDECFPDPPLLPGDALQRARMRAAALAIACDIHPLNNLRVLGYLKKTFGQDQSSVDRWYAHWIRHGFEALETSLAVTAGRYCFADRVTLPDLLLVPQVYNARRFAVDMSAFPTLERIDAALTGLAAFAAAAPERQPDAD